MFPSAAFEPTDKDLAGDADEESDIEMTDVKPAKATSKGKGKAKAKRPVRKTAKAIVLDSSDIDGDETEEDDDAYDSELSDFIVGSDEDEEEKDARRSMKKRLGKSRAITTIVDSDDEDEDEDAPEEKEVLFGAKPRLSKAAIKLMPRFLPSTKMKVGIAFAARCHILKSSST